MGRGSGRSGHWGSREGERRPWRASRWPADNFRVNIVTGHQHGPREGQIKSKARAPCSHVRGQQSAHCPDSGMSHVSLFSLV